jgi:hypothetical protein
MSKAIRFPETRAKAAELQPPQEMREIGDVVKFHREAVADDGSTAAAGLNVLDLAADGRVRRNHTFVDGA